MTTPQATPPMNTLFQHKYDDALKTVRKMRGMGEYLWAAEWESYAKNIHAYWEKHQRACDYVARQNRKNKERAAKGLDVLKVLPEPEVSWPPQPRNLSHVDRDGESFRQQSTSYNRNPMYQCVRV